MELSTLVLIAVLFVALFIQSVLLKRLHSTADYLRRRNAFLEQEQANYEERLDDIASLEKEKTEAVCACGRLAERVRLLENAGNELSAVAGRVAETFPGRDSLGARELRAAAFKWEDTKAGLRR